MIDGRNIDLDAGHTGRAPGKGILSEIWSWWRTACYGLERGKPGFFSKASEWME